MGKVFSDSNLGLKSSFLSFLEGYLKECPKKFLAEVKGIQSRLGFCME